MPFYMSKAPTKVEESKGDTGMDGAKESISLDELISAVVGNYFEDRLFEDEVKNGYLKSLKDNKNYRKTQTYVQAKKLYEPEETKFKKDQSLHKDKQTVILGLEGVLAKLSLEEMRNCDAKFEIGQNGLVLGTVILSITLAVRQTPPIFAGVLGSHCEEICINRFLQRLRTLLQACVRLSGI
eukprot:TRINITY_DN3896_c0_g1_i10.p1 TRINITY_DN3896_c0_g1~~TRINITY_DN3896_c0_g1_i10.p1  ORF type:complete len:182 (-),score=12.17 TRINITY_DN3896_c0_g1_i10:377-922(-)